MLDAKSSELVKGLLKDYYSKVSDISPHSIERREFGFGDFERKIAYRHVAFRDWKALKTYLVNDAPPFVSVSSAHYQHPDGRPMENKGSIGAELVFDLDANDLNLPCAKEHGSSWVCDKCLDGGESGNPQAHRGLPDPRLRLQRKRDRGQLQRKPGLPHPHKQRDRLRPWTRTRGRR